MCRLKCGLGVIARDGALPVIGLQQHTAKSSLLLSANDPSKPYVTFVLKSALGHIDDAELFIDKKVCCRIVSELLFKHSPFVNGERGEGALGFIGENRPMKPKHISRCIEPFHKGKAEATIGRTFLKKDTDGKAVFETITERLVINWRTFFLARAFVVCAVLEDPGAIIEFMKGVGCV